MAEIIIKKRVDLGYLGEDYKDSYLTFKSIAVRDFPAVIKKLDSVGDDDSLEKKLKTMLSVLEEHYVEGIYDKQKVEKEDIGKFDQETILRAFEKLTGQDITKEVPIDPKDVKQ